MRYLVIIETTPTGFSAYVPDLPGCIATGSSKDEIEKNIREAIEFHVEGLHEQGLAVPSPHTDAEYLEIAA
jgi:predicted RNase H-like HicB family nuclease